MNNRRYFVLLPLTLALTATGQAQSVRLTGPRTFEADGTILISGRLGWTQTNDNGFSTGKLNLIDWSEFTGVNYDYRLEVQEWFVPVFDRNLVYEGPIARIKFLGNPYTTYPARARIGIGFARVPGQSAQGFYEFGTHFARMDSNPNPPPVPEPATLMALSAGLVALVRKRRS